MSFAIKTTLENLKSYLLARGWFDEVTIGFGSTIPDGDAYTAQIFLAAGSLTYLTQSTTIQTHTVTIRICRNILSEPSELTEIEMSDLVATLIAAAIGHFDLTSAIANLDVFTIDVRWDAEEVGGVMCRTAEIDLPLSYREAAS